jgi:predicted RNase H-like HicB family nuclease
MRFPVVLHTDDGTRYGVTVPDLPGCFSGGDTFDTAMDSAAEAIDLHLEGLTKDGHDVPTPQPISHHQKTPDYAGGVWALVEVGVIVTG